MALVSPGVEITVIDQSQYLPAAPASVPLILLATAQNKVNAAGTDIAAGTTQANANKLYRVTSQRDLVTLFGNPFFYKTTNGTSIQGYELNEYGLLAAYSVLGTTNLCYVLRADIDLASLVGRTGRPSGAPADGTHWLDTTQTTWGIFEFNQVSGQFTSKTPLVLTDGADLANTMGEPLSSIGNIGDYAITFVTDNNGFTTAEQPNTYNTYWYKDKNNTWVKLGNTDWRMNWPTVQGTETPSTLTPGNTFTVSGVTITVPTSPNNTVLGVASQINAADIAFVTAASVNGKLEIYHELDSMIVIGAGTGTVLTNLGVTSGTYYTPEVFFGSNAQQPLWRSTDAQPHPTGSVWIKTNAANNGTNLVVSRYEQASATYTNLSCRFSTNDWTVTNSLDSTGGKNIPEGTLYASYSFDQYNNIGPVQLFSRFTTGPAIFIGSYTSPTITAGGSFKVYISVPGSSTLSSAYTVNMPLSPAVQDAADFVTAWTAANIPFTTAEVSTTGAILLTHTEGGVIILDDSNSGTSPVSEAGFMIGVTPGAKWGPYKILNYTTLTSSGGLGSGATFNVSTNGFNPTFTVVNPGTGYAVNNILTVSGGGPLSTPYQVKVLSVGVGGTITNVEWFSGFSTPQYMVQLSNWEILSYIPNDIAPTVYPADGTNWYYSVVNQADIMTNVGGVWKGYRNVRYASNGLPQNTGTPVTDINGPIISSSAPETQSGGGSLQYGDLWIDTSDLENYPVINRWQNVSGIDQWVRLDNTDQTTENGVLFADARWAENGTVDPIDDGMTKISTLLTSDYIDLDAPDPSLYPQGTLLFNTRRSGYNVKQFRFNYFNALDFPDLVLPQEKSTWVTVSGNMTNGAPYMGRKAQRAMIVQSLKAAIGTNSQIREDDTFFNLIASPNYPELQPDMVVLNNDRNNTAYIIGDTPLRLEATGQSISDWANNVADASSTGEMGLVKRDTYMGIYYPSGITTDLTGAQVVVPASHMILRTMIYNDKVAYPWFAPAGQRRGIVDNATNIGYLDGNSGEFIVNKNRVELRDVEYTNFINPIAYFTNIGVVNYGNKNSFDSQSALDRTNVSRLICYIREQLRKAVRPFIFEPNDTITRAEVTGVCSTLLNDILSKRGIYDYLVVCDESNNTPDRIDRNELWVDIAIEPVKAVEFIYIPIRVLNTGEIAGLGLNG